MSHHFSHRLVEFESKALAALLCIALLTVSVFPLTIAAQTEGEAPTETATPPTPPPPLPPEAPPADEPVTSSGSDGASGPTDDGTQTDDGEPGTGAGSEPVVEVPEGVGEPGGDGSGSEATDVTIGTGDADSLAESNTAANVNDVTLPPPPPPGGKYGGHTTKTEDDGTTTTGSTTPSGPSSAEGDVNGSGESKLPKNFVPGPEVSVNATNTADILNELDSTAGTGDNTGIGRNVDITTGNAIATANIRNLINTNIFNSVGLFLFLDNLMSGMFGDLDLRNLDFFTPQPDQEPPCTVRCGKGFTGPASTTINTDNTATTTNAVIVRAQTGGNTASSTGYGSIETGDAFAAANIVNVVNTNIIDSNYLLLTFNNFGDWFGDVVFPAKELFLALFGIQSTPSSNFSVTTDNSAVVGNGVSVDASTGDNSASSTGEGVDISTGDADAYANVQNQINTNLIGGSGLSILFRVHGSWSGDIFGAPEGVSWVEHPDGSIQLFFGEGGSGSGGCCGYPGLTVNTNNDANIFNDVSVIALTGENQITSAGGGSIETGNAYAAANVINVANTNVVGANWLLAIVNIFGDWDGNIQFGKPDLWIGGSASFAGEPSAGKEVSYTFTIANNGDAAATGVKLSGLFDEYLSLPATVAGALRDAARKIVWQLGTIRPGEVHEVTISTNIAGDLPYGDIPIDTEATVTSSENDEDSEDNTDVIAFVVNRGPAPGREGGGPATGSIPGGGGGAGGTWTPRPVLELAKSHNEIDSIAPAGSIVSYKIVIRNEYDGAAYDAVLADVMKDADGKVIAENGWDLGTVLPREEIVVSYDVEFAGNFKPGVYTNEARVYALGGHPTAGYEYDSPIATATIEIVANPNALAEEDGTDDDELADETFASAFGDPHSQTPDGTLKKISGVRKATSTMLALVTGQSEGDEEALTLRNRLLAAALFAGGTPSWWVLWILLLLLVLLAEAERKGRKWLN